MSWMLNTCITCHERDEASYYKCAICNKGPICGDCMHLSSEYNARTLCKDCNTNNKKEKKIIHRTYEYRNGILRSIRLSYIYRGIHDDPSISELDVILDDYLTNGTPYINKEIAIIDNHKITSTHNPTGTKYKIVLNLYNNSILGDTFTIMPTF